MSEFTVSDTHQGVSVSIAVKVAANAKRVEGLSLHLIPRIDDYSIVGGAVRAATLKATWGIATDVTNAINECASAARFQEIERVHANHQDAIGNAVTAERERMQAIHTGQLEGRDSVINSLAEKISALEAEQAATVAIAPAFSSRNKRARK